MNRKKDTDYGINRPNPRMQEPLLYKKNSADFILMPLVAASYYKQISSYFEQHANVPLTSGQIYYEVVLTEEPAVKHTA